MIKIKDGVKFVYAPGGIRIIQALKSISKMINHDLTITSGADGVHSSSDDPHYRGDAYDVRSHDLGLIEKQQVLANLNNLLPRAQFYYFLENSGTPNEHFHIQTKNGTQFTIQDLLNA